MALHRFEGARNRNHPFLEPKGKPSRCGGCHDRKTCRRPFWLPALPFQLSGHGPQSNAPPPGCRPDRYLCRLSGLRKRIRLRLGRHESHHVSQKAPRKSCRTGGQARRLATCFNLTPSPDFPKHESGNPGGCRFLYSSITSILLVQRIVPPLERRPLTIGFLIAVVSARIRRPPQTRLVRILLNDQLMLVLNRCQPRLHLVEFRRGHHILRLWREDPLSVLPRVLTP